MVRQVLQIGLFIVTAMVIWFSFTTPAPQQQIGDASRIFYYHIPVAWLTVVAYAVNLIFSIRYLKTRTEIDDFRALWAAEIGTMFCVLATISGSLFAKVTWGVYWNWSEPRMLSIFVLLMIYGAYLAIRAAIPSLDRRATLGAVYAIFAFPTVPFFIFIMPRMMASLHPSDSVIDANLKISMGGSVLPIFLISLAVFTVIFFWLYGLGVRLHKVQTARRETE
ncbi:MAG: cytochrome c biogenesis protein CcsA [candidate division Zixibacteria bacterium]|nr:cytochrome c biogenesis protein CcsA [candidate division Zixibacteria bacterium]